MTSGLLGQAARSVAINTATNWFGLLAATLSLIIVARLLSPSDFGLFAMALVVLVIPEVLANLSPSVCLIQRPGISDAHVRVAFTVSITASLVLMAAIMLAAPVLAGLFAAPDLTGVLRAMSLVLVIGAFTSVPAALLQRTLQFGRISIVDTAGVIAATITGISLALALGSVWALVGMELARRLVRMAGFAALARWRPAFGWNRSAASDMAAFTRTIMGTELLKRLDSETPRAAIGLVLGPAALGLFQLAERLGDQMKTVLVNPFAAVALPVAARSSENRTGLREAIGWATRMSAFLAYPAFIGAAAIAAPGIPFAFGPQWTDAVPVVQLALLSALVVPTTAMNNGIFQGIGQPGAALKLRLAGLFALALILPVVLPLGIVWTMAGLLVQRVAVWIGSVVFLQRLVGIPARSQVSNGMRFLVLAILMGLAVVALGAALPETLPAGLRLLVQILAGVAIYVSGALLLVRDLSAEFASLAKALLARDWPAARRVATDLDDLVARRADW